ncbi:FAD-dependent oxidoreductase [uncultured Abyssibacter sp.]|uniref:NAD(P)/FAD-dependent oxidoreductase n=1 Tax=uncultured Abyssibacter sp. TaxID=2320202 RepID=UPI0032B14C99
MNDRRVVLVGAGHAHLHVIRHAARFRDIGATLTVIAPRAFRYSGLATSVLGGRHAPEQDTLDIAAFCDAQGAEFVEGEVAAVDTDARVVRLVSGESRTFDWLSLNTGSRIDQADGAEANLYPVKPLDALWALRERLESTAMSAPSSITIVGGGATGCEVAANLTTLTRRLNRNATLSLVHAGERLLPGHAPGAARFLRRWLEERGCAVRLGERLDAADARQTKDALVVLATGLRANLVDVHPRPPVDPEQGWAVNDHLQSQATSRLFAAGDCAWLVSRPLPKLGVYGVRQGPVLLDNLLASCTSGPLRLFRPQRRALSILNLGGETGLALYGSAWFRGRWVLAWKHWLDRRFLRRHRSG